MWEGYSWLPAHTAAVRDNEVENNKIVTVSAECKMLRGRGYRQWGAPLEVELVGNKNTLTDLAEFLFDFSLRETLGEELYFHHWGFETATLITGVLSLDLKVPILSPNMKAYTKTGLEMFSCGTTRYVSSGDALTFHYDEFYPTIIDMKIKSIRDKKPTEFLEDYPRVNESALFEPHGISIDSAFPHLSRAVLSMRHGGAFFGNCGSIYGAIQGGIAQGEAIQGSGTDCSTSDLLFCPYQFECMEDYLICANKALRHREVLMVQRGIQDVQVIVIPPERQEDAIEERIEAFYSPTEYVSAIYRLSNYHMVLVSSPGSDTDLPVSAERDDSSSSVSPVRIVCRLTPAEVTAERAALREKNFDFAQLYPMINAVTKKSSEREIWFRISQRRVLVAEGMKSGMKSDSRVPVEVLSESRVRYVTMRHAFREVDRAIWQAEFTVPPKKSTLFEVSGNVMWYVGLLGLAIYFLVPTSYLYVFGEVITLSAMSLVKGCVMLFAIVMAFYIFLLT
jgi:hypothetical protein